MRGGLGAGGRASSWLRLHVVGLWPAAGTAGAADVSRLGFTLKASRRREP